MAGSSKREDELIREGWMRRFVAREPRLGEAVELYRSMGYQVHLEPLPLVDCDSADKGSEECRACFKGFEDQYKTIYTRLKRAESAEGNLC